MSERTIAVVVAEATQVLHGGKLHDAGATLHLPVALAERYKREGLVRDETRSRARGKPASKRR